jgi:hypothetical protein
MVVGIDQAGHYNGATYIGDFGVFNVSRTLALTNAQDIASFQKQISILNDFVRVVHRDDLCVL